MNTASVAQGSSLPDRSAAKSNSSAAASLNSDPSLQPFTKEDFDPVDYFNAVLPKWSSHAHASAQQRHLQPSQNGHHASQQQTSLAEISNQTQAHVTKLNTQLSTLSDTLTQLVDEILRSGGRLSYEVEVLRGDTASLQDTIHERLRADIEQFASAAFAPNSEEPAAESEAKAGSDVPTTAAVSAATGAGAETASALKEDTKLIAMPDYMTRLRTLSLVRERLDTVIRTFGAAIDWTMAPSELAALSGASAGTAKASSFITISAPEPAVTGSTMTEEERKELESRGKEHAERVRSEIDSLVGDGTDADGVRAAVRRIQELRELVNVWKGTVEEKPRTRFVDSLAKLIEDKKGSAWAPRPPNAA